MARPTAVHWASCAGRAVARPRRAHAATAQIPDAVWQVYPDLSHAHDWEAAIKATSFVPDDVVAQLCDALGLVGTPSTARTGSRRWRSSASAIYLMPFQTFAPPEPEVHAFRDAVFPRLAAAGLR